VSSPDMTSSSGRTRVWALNRADRSDAELFTDITPK